MRQVIILPAARIDMLEQAEYYDSEGGEHSATVSSLNVSQLRTAAAFPESGTRVRLKHPLLKGCRCILAPEFEKVLIFYTLSNEEVQIVRVFHGARDIESVLD